MGPPHPEEKGPNYRHDEMVQCSISEKNPDKLPKMVNKANAFEEKNGYTLWQNAIQKEIENLKIAFQTIPEGEKPHDGLQYINPHMVSYNATLIVCNPY